MSTTSPVPPEYAALVDDAAVFPPGNAPLDRAVTAHREHRAAPYADLVGPFVVGDDRLPELLDLLEVRRRDAGEVDPLPVSVVVSRGAGGLEPAVRWAEGSPLLDLRGLELALRDPDDLPGNARRVVAAAVDLGLEVPVHVELPQLTGDLSAGPGHGWLAALDEVAAAELRLKVRTGGVTADLFPGPEAVTAAIDAALDRELPFKCTAGLHHAVRHTDPATGFRHHGFLNVLLATRASLDGEDAVSVLAEEDPAALVARATSAGGEALVRARRWFVSFGCCEVAEPLEDLRDLGLIPH